MPLSRRADLLRLIEFRLNVPTIEQAARTPGSSEAFRVIVQCHDPHQPNRVATLTLGQIGGGSAHLSVCYLRPDSRALILTPAITHDRARAFVAGFRLLDFDRLDDMPDLPWHGVDLWLIERAAGTFRHDIVLAPATARGIYSKLAALVNEHLPEIARKVNI